MPASSDAAADHRCDARTLMHDAAPLFDSLRRFVERDQAPFYSPGHKGGRTLDPWFREHIADARPEQPARHRHPALPRGADPRSRAADRRRLGCRAELHPGPGFDERQHRRRAVGASTRRAGSGGAQRPQVGAGGPGAGRCPADLAGTAVGRTIRRRTRTGRRRRRARVRATVARRRCGCCTPPTTAPPATSRRWPSCAVATTPNSSSTARIRRTSPSTPTYRRPARRSGAAATVQSVHKILSGLSQAAVLHVDPTSLDPATVRRALQLIQTTSPHFAIMASIDLARRQMVLGGRRLLDETLDRARRAAARLAPSPA